MSNSSKTLLKVLQRLSETRGFKANLAKKMGASPTQIQEYVSGKTVPSLDVVDRIAEALGVHPWELLKPEGANETLDPLLAKVAARWSELNEAERGTVVSVTNALADKFIADPQAKNLVPKQKKSSA